MLAALLPVPLVLAALHTSHVRVVLSLNPFISFFATMWMGSAAAAIQDCVLPRMRATAGAIYLCAISILGLRLGPYSTGKIAGIAGSLKVGLVSVQAVVPLALLLLWVAAQRIAAAEDTRIERARAAGERC
jgi:hypothetical protein